MASQRLLWTPELMLKLVDAVKEQPLLSNPKHGDYKHRSKKKAAFHRVAAQLQLPVEAVSQKWDVLKSSYHKYRRELEKQERPATAIRWFAFDRLSFLTPAGEVCGASDVTDVPTNSENMEATHMGPQTALGRDTAIPPTTQETPRPNNRSNRAVLESLLKIIEEELKTVDKRSWADVMGSYVALEVQQAGERPDTDMRELHSKLMRLMQEFRREGELGDTQPSPSAISTYPLFE